MSATPPLPIDDLPITPSPDRPDTFDPEADEFLEKLQPWGQQVEAVGANAYANAVDAAASATVANAKAGDAAGSAGVAAGHASTASTQADIATTKADEASDSAAESASYADASANSATGVIATSTTNVAVGAGTKTFATQLGKQFSPGVLLAFASVSDPTKKMWGSVSAYSGTTLDVLISDFVGVGSASDWKIAPGGAPGPAGTLAAGNISGALNLAKAAPVASAASPDIWATLGNLVHITGTTAITGFANAPQPGAQRWLVADAAFTLTSGANLSVKGSTRKTEVGDVIVVTADTTTTFTAHVLRSTGRATVAPLRYLEITTTQSWPVIAEDFIVELWGGGPGGGSNTPGSGAPGYVKKTFSGATVGALATIVIGAGGAGAAGDSTDPPPIQSVAGSPGTASTFTLAGFTQLVANTGGVGAANANGDPGAGGTASGGDINQTGSEGDYATGRRDAVFGYGGDAGSNYLCTGGKGGAGNAGRQGSGFGAPGGSGGYSGDTSGGFHARAAGANGRAGIARIWY